MKATAKSVDPTLAGVEFLRTELRTGLTFTRIALETSRKHITSRNRENARKAYDTVLRFSPKVALSNEEMDEIKSKLEQLRAELQLLGEGI